MGDRGNIVVVHHVGAKKIKRIFLYTHWAGTEIASTLQTALQRKQRWDDEAYLTRIIFCEMIGDDIKGETGFGIGGECVDNEHNVLVVDCAKQTVGVSEDRDAKKIVRRVTFDGFIAFSEEELQKFFEPEE